MICAIRQRKKRITNRLCFRLVAIGILKKTKESLNLRVIIQRNLIILRILRRSNNKKISLSLMIKEEELALETKITIKLITSREVMFMIRKIDL